MKKWVCSVCGYVWEGETTVLIALPLVGKDVRELDPEKDEKVEDSDQREERAKNINKKFLLTSACGHVILRT